MRQTNKPIIGITSSIVNYKNITSFNIHEKQIRSVIQAGGVPIIIPTGTQEMTEEWVTICNGIILSSGEDVDPNSFSAQPHPKIQKTSKKRDMTEIGLIRNAEKQNKPILGICRGLTMLNVALGGTVIQDIESNNSLAIKHYQQASRSEPTHDIQIDNTSRLYQILNRTKFQVNSMHHQAIDQIAKDLRNVAVALDGVIEAVENFNEASPTMMGVQWHPEEMASEDKTMQRIFDWFIAECKKI